MLVQLGGAYAVVVTANDVNLQDLHLQANPAVAQLRGLHIPNGSTVQNLTLDNVNITGAVNRYGIQVSGVALDLSVINSFFSNNAVGILIADDGLIDGLTLTGSAFDHGPDTTTGETGLYVSNDSELGNDQGILRNATISGNTFTGLSPSLHPGNGLYIEEAQTVLIENNTFTGNRRGIQIYKDHSPARVLSNVTIRGNNFVDQTNAGIRLQNYKSVDVISIEDNTFTDNVRGISLHGDGTGWNTTHASGNSFTGSDAGVEVTVHDEPGDNLDGTAFNATCNWWGSATGPGPVGPGSGDEVTTNVDFSGWLTTDDLNGLCAGDTSSISGMKWNDANSDRQTLGESGIVGWTINLFSSSFVGDPLVRVIGASPIASTTTDSDGNYSFINLDPDLDYVVCEEAQSNWNQTSPTLRSDGPVTCANDTVGHTAQNNGAGTPQTFTNINFGNHNTPTTTTSTTTTSTTPVKAQTYTVVSGDTLYGIGTAVGVDWHLIASINNISAPYTIYPGQVLQLPGSTVVVASQTTTSSSESASDFGDEGATAVKAVSTLNPINKAVSDFSEASTSVAKNSGIKWYWWVVIVLLAGSLIGSYVYNAANRDDKSNFGR